MNLVSVSAACFCAWDVSSLLDWFCVDQGSLLNAMSLLAVTSIILFLNTRGAGTRSSCANLLGVHGALNPFVADSLKVHFWCTRTTTVTITITGTVTVTISFNYSCCCCYGYNLYIYLFIYIIYIYIIVF